MKEIGEFAWILSKLGLLLLILGPWIIFKEWTLFKFKLLLIKLFIVLKLLFLKPNENTIND